MKRIILLLSLSLPLAGAAFHLSNRPVPATAPDSNPPSSASQQFIAAPGLVEPVSEEIKVGSEITGKLQTVPVLEGDHVSRGQIVAILSNDDFRARLASAQADLDLKEAELDRIRNGARPQERRQALAETQEAEAVMENARSVWSRRRTLLESGVVSRLDYEQTEREYNVARARHEAALQRYALVNDPARQEDVARAEAAVRLARASVEEAQARLDKTFVRSPIDGIVLRRYSKSGESVKDTGEPPIVTLGNVTVWRVRADVDETDIARVRPGQRAYVTADAFGEKKFWGRVVRVGQILGKKNIRTEEPTERVDKKILETLIEMDDAGALRAGLRVTVFIAADPASGPNDR